MRWLWSLMYSEYHLVASDEDLERRVREVVVRPGGYTLKLTTQIFVFWAIPVLVFTVFLFSRIRQNPSLPLFVLPLSVALFSVGFSPAFLFLTRKARNRVFRRALIDCGVPVCIGCGYDLAERGEADACPECGAPIPKAADQQRPGSPSGRVDR